MYKKFIILVGLLSILLINPIVVKAQEVPRLDITVTPPVIELKTKPNVPIKGSFRIRNNTNELLDLDVEVAKMKNKGEYGDATVDEEDKTDLEWFQFTSPKTFSAPVKDWSTVSFTISPDESSAFGYYYAIRIKQTAQLNSPKTSAKLSGEVLVLVLLNIDKPGSKAELKLLNFLTTKNIYEYLPTEFIARIENIGNIYLKPKGSIFIKDWTGKQVGIVDVNETNGSVLPDSIRRFGAEWNDGFVVSKPIIQEGQKVLDSRGKAKTKLTFNWNKLTDLRFGKYTAQLLMVYDNGERDISLENAVSFWVIPYTFIGICVAVLLIIGLIIRFFIHWYVNKILKSYRK